FDTFVELSPHPLLTSAVSQGLRHRGVEGAAVGSLRRGLKERESLAAAAGELYRRGQELEWGGVVGGGGRCVELPVYPWQRERFWASPEAVHASVNRTRQGQNSPRKHPLLGRRVELAQPAGAHLWEAEISNDSIPYLNDHCVEGMMVLPGAIHLEMVFAAARERFTAGTCFLKQVDFHKALFLSEGEVYRLQLTFTPDSEDEVSFIVHSRSETGSHSYDRWARHVTGKLLIGDENVAAPDSEGDGLEAVRVRCDEEISGADFYRKMNERGNQWGPTFQGIERIWRRDGEALGQLIVPHALRAESASYQMHPAVLDACIQVLGAAIGLEDAHGNRRGAYLGRAAEQIHIYGPLRGFGLWSHAVVRPEDQRSAVRLGDVRVFDESGRLVIEALGVQVQHLDRDLRAMREDGLDDWLYEIQWQAKAVSSWEPARSGASLLRAPGEVVEHLGSQLPALNARHQMEVYDDLKPRLDSLCTAQVVNALKQLGWEFRPGERVSTDSLAGRLKVVSQHRRLFNRMLEMLQEDGTLGRTGAEWEVCSTPESVDPQKISDAFFSLYPDWKEYLSLVETCGRHLADVLAGRCDSLQLLFPNGSFETVEKLYQDSPAAKVFNTLVQEAFGKALEHLPPGQTIRVLEVGAGTGGTTAYVLSKLSADRTEYVFTDVSPLFINYAQQKFGEHRFIQYELLDIEQDPAAQGFAHREFDVILGANVLHATSELRRTIDHVKTLLAPEGMLILLEGTSPQRSVDLIFGLTEGWWKFSDSDLRPTHPLLSQGQWRSVLTHAGFTDVTAMPAAENGNQSPSQSVIIAKAPRREAVAQTAVDTSTSSKGQGRWLIFADRRGVGRELAQMLGARGEDCCLVSHGEGYGGAGTAHVSLNPSRPEDFERLINEALHQGRVPCHGVVHLWSLDAAPTEETTLAALEEAQNLGCISVLHLVQQLAGKGPGKTPRLWLVTREAQSLAAAAEPVSVAQSPLWGLGKTIANELPEFHCTNVDLSFTEAAAGARSLFEELWSDTDEDQIAYREGERYVARLVGRSLKAAETAAPPLFHADGTYLITGGFGGLGLTVARWLVERGARHLVLMGRHGASDAAQATMDSLAAMGARVEVAIADAADTASVAGVLARIEQTMPPLRGVIHAALILDDGIVLQLNEERFKRVMAPKVGGAWNLHTLTAHLPLDFFVLFSSAVSLLGPPGQGNYSAASAFIDALAHYRRAAGLPGLSINWGPWAEVGQAARPELDGRLSLGVFNSLLPEQGLKVFGALLHQDLAQVGVLPINWSRFSEVYPTGRKNPLISHLISESLRGRMRNETPAKAADTLTRDALLTAPPDERQRLLESYLCERIAHTLGSSPSGLDVHQPLNRLGLDSLMAIELKTAVETNLGVVLPISVLLQGPDTIELAAEILKQLPKPAATSLPAIQPHPATWHEPFPLNDIQQAYWIGRNTAFELGNVAPHAYVEFETESFNGERLNLVCQKLIERHGMLRAVVDSDGRQRVLAEVPPYRLGVLDLSESEEAQVEAELETIRERMSHQVLPSDRWPLFEVRATRLGEHRYRVHVSTDLLFTDAFSILTIIDEGMRLYDDLEAPLPALEITFRDYIMAEAALQESEVFRQSKDYWMERLPTIPPAPELPLVTDPGSLDKPQFTRRTAKLDAETWLRLKNRAIQAGLTPSAVLCTAFAEVLARWSKRQHFTLSLTLFNRLPLHPQVNEIVGDFTTINPLEIDCSTAATVAAQAQRVQEQLWRDLDHNHFSGVKVLRELNRIHGGAPKAKLPIVFTNLLEDLSGMERLGNLVYSISQTPQVWLDHQVLEQGGALIFNWDAVADLFPPSLLDEMFSAYRLLLARLAANDSAWHAPTHPLLPQSQLAARAAANQTG
ncbi:MAG: SDR family NAD(P)-dependent oxidoreductase, partial [Pyrinomonadaceae bacterium]